MEFSRNLLSFDSFATHFLLRWPAETRSASQCDAVRNCSSTRAGAAWLSGSVLCHLQHKSDPTRARENDLRFVACCLLTPKYSELLPRHMPMRPTSRRVTQDAAKLPHSHAATIVRDGRGQRAAACQHRQMASPAKVVVLPG